MVVLTFILNCIHEITALKVSQMPSDLTLDESKRALKATMLELSKKKFQLINIPCSRPEATEFRRIIDTVEQEMLQYSHLLPLMDKYKERRKVHEEIAQNNKKLK